MRPSLATVDRWFHVVIDVSFRWGCGGESIWVRLVLMVRECSRRRVTFNREEVPIWAQRRWEERNDGDSKDISNVRKVLRMGLRVKDVGVRLDCGEIPKGKVSIGFRWWCVDCLRLACGDFSIGDVSIWSLILGIGCGVKELRSVHGFILKWFQWWMEDSIWLVSGEFSGGIVLNSVLIMEYEYGLNEIRGIRGEFLIWVRLWFDLQSIKVPEPVYGEALNRIRQWLDWGRNTKLNCVLMDLRSIPVGVWYGFTLLVGVYFLWSVYVVISIWVLNSTLRGLVPADSRWFSWSLSGCSLWVSVYLGIILVGLILVWRFPDRAKFLTCLEKDLELMALA